MSLEYSEYIRTHLMNVSKGLRWIIENLPLKDLGYSDMDIWDAEDHVMVHDASKQDYEEYKPYDTYFYGGNRSNKVCTEFDHAWLRHIHHNPHHWQYWILVNDDKENGSKALEIPGCYILEMLADWWSFSWKDNDLYSIFDWWEKHDSYILLHKRSRARVEDTLNALREKLDENDILEHGELTEEELEKRKYALPEQRKFPMPDARHVRSAIRFFNYVDRKDEEKLAKAILERMKEYGMSFEDFTVGDENRFKKYIQEEDHLEES